jgi:hypothetical protein
VIGLRGDHVGHGVARAIPWPCEEWSRASRPTVAFFRPPLAESTPTAQSLQQVQQRLQLSAFE